MQISFLGTNGWFSTPTGDTPCIVIRTKDFTIVLDAGNGIYKLDEYIDQRQPVYLFLSHLHLDHTAGLHILDKFHFKHPLTLYVPTGMKKPLLMLLKHPFTKPVDELPYQVDVHEIAEGTVSVPFPASAVKLFHSDTNFGYRFELEGKIVAYSGDSGICENSTKLAKNADLLIHECSFEPGHGTSAWGHVNPAQAAMLAKETGVKRLVLTHFSANIYTTRALREEALTVAKKIFPNTDMATDGMIIEV